ncbi:MAG: MarR family winged helix-turn-helix transcriptional regulator [Desulfovibrio sp.]
MEFTYQRKKSVGHLTALVNRLSNNLLGKRFQEAGIDMTPEQWGALLVLFNGDALTQQQLGEQLYLEKSSVSRLVDGLERRGWVARTRNPGDGRNKLVSLMPKALAVADRCADIARDVLEVAQRGLSEEERLACQSFLGRIIANLE